jgi:peptidoglycan hydrolase CwlO-like protein
MTTPLIPKPIKFMKGQKFIFAAVLLILFALSGFSQTKSQSNVSAVNSVKSTPAYAEILLRKTELTAELESLLVEYTEEYPKVSELRAELMFLQKDLDKILAVSAADIPKLSTALGKLIVRKAELETVLWKLQKDYKDDHSDVKTAKRKVQVFELAIREILPLK